MMKKKLDITTEEIRNWLVTDENSNPTPKEIKETEESLLTYANAHAITPPQEVRAAILDKIKKLNHQKNHRQRLDIKNLPLLEASSNWIDWEDVVKEIEAPEDFDNIHLESLESNDTRELFVAWVKEMVEEEVHHDLLESFLILEGSCKCHITNESGESRIVYLNQGDFITLPIGESHNICITSTKPTKAILQWLKKAS